MATRSRTFSVTDKTEYYIGSIIADDYQNKRTLFNPSEIVRKAVDFLVREQYPHLVIEE